MYPLKQSTALTVLMYAHDVNGDAVNSLTDGSWTKRISKNAGAFAAMTVTITFLENGWYSVPLSTVHTDTLGVLTLTFTNAGAKQVNLQYRVDARVPDDLAYPAVTGRSLDVAAAGTVLLQAATHTGAVIPTTTAVTNPVTVGTNNDKTGYALSAAGVQAIWDVLTSAGHAAGSIGLGLSRFIVNGFYQNGAVWIDTLGGAAGAVSGVNGTNRNPVNNLADANTLATELNLTRFEMAPGSSITFVAPQTGQIFNNPKGTIALGGQNVANSLIIGGFVSGIGTGAGFILRRCDLVGSTTVGGSPTLNNCTLAGTVVVGAATTMLLENCKTAVIGGAPAVIDYGAAIGATTINVRNYSGPVEVQNMGQVAGADEFLIDGAGGQIIFNANCIGGSATIRGNFDLVDNSGGAVTITQTARVTNKTVQAEILSDAIPFAGANIDVAISSRLATAGYTAPDNAGIAANGTAIATVQADTDDIQTRLPAALVGGRMDSDIGAIAGTPTSAARIERSTKGIVLGTVGAASTTTSIVTSSLDPAASVIDQFKGRIVTFQQDTTSAALRGQSTDITANTAAGILAVTALTTAPVSGDTFVIT